MTARGAALRRPAAVVSLVLSTLLGAMLPAASQAGADTNQMVIVTAVAGLNPVTSVLSVAGTVLTQYTVINGVEASVPSSQVPVLAATPGLTVTPDVSVAVQSTAVSTGPHTPSDSFLAQTGATRLAQSGDTGRGVTVAVLDTGISPLPDFANRLIGGVDLTSGNNPFQDSYGHGTFVAGLIAGNGASSGGQYSGEAPGANLVSIKVAGADGSTHLGTLISGLQWAVNNRSTYGIRVLNVSLGYQSTQSTVNNPLDQAVEKAWASGITVVASAGNAGPFNGTILSPGDDPMVITAGALDDLAQANVAADEMTDFSSAGPTSTDGWEKPDLVTSGRSVVSLADPGSTIYNANPSARAGSGNFVGSGTSFSAAITSGAAALVLANHADLAPNQVKGQLLSSTDPGPVGNPFVDGHGALDAYNADTAPTVGYNQSANGLIAVQPGTTIALKPVRSVDSWNPALWSGWTGSEWNGSEWNGAAWNGSEWNGSEWNGFTWTGSEWNGAAWNGSEWNGSEWNGAAWNGSEWNGAAWNGSEWNGSEWN